MTNDFLAVSDGTFTLSETQDKDKFYFYRNDGLALNDIDRETIMDLYQQYIMSKMINGEIMDVIMNNIIFEISNDRKCIRLTICEIDEDLTCNNDFVVNKRPNFLKRLICRIFS